ncbi:hypothetical protein [Burkholderia vietnamiensis]|uniref:hypothetical protein n=1 Tax=Burkholderia vietnamiensis TaxID=60552 RepID=UPI001B8F62FB|nr:hypothetical protein [Burkholderia vietnamiensis]MBR8003867.1 hypothetical protein [Burkholderia vietnamiensis]
MNRTMVGALSNLPALERECLKILISNACKARFTSAGSCKKEASEPFFLRLKDLLAPIRSPAAKKSETGVIFKGFLPEFTHDVMIQLREEARGRREKAEVVGRQLSIKGGPRALELALTVNFRSIALMDDAFLEPTGYANYAYYEQEGSGIAPHIDSYEYPVNAILCLSHEYPRDRVYGKSALCIFNKHLKPISYFLQPGEIIVFHGESFIHYRSPLEKNEQLTILAFGLRIE